MKVYYVATTRMPNALAHGIQIAKTAEALIEAGVDLTLVVPKRNGETESLQTFYDLRVAVPVVRLPSLDWYRNGPLWYRLSALSFMAMYVLYLWGKRLLGEQFLLYTVDLDNYSSSALAFVGRPLYSEMHGGKADVPMQRLLFSALTGVIATNPITARELKERFPKSEAQYLIEPNGVDLDAFAPLAKEEARKKLGLSPDERIVLYTGRFFDWKGLEILPEAAHLTPDTTWYIVGGDEEEFVRVAQVPVAPNMHFVGFEPYARMALWQSASDALIVLGTKRDTQSYSWTSPMKLFEYLLSERPIVASATPAITSIVSPKEVLLYEPDDATSMARAVEQAIQGGEELPSLVEAARTLGERFSWKGRGERIKRFLGI